MVNETKASSSASKSVFDHGNFIVSSNSKTAALNHTICYINVSGIRC